MGLASNATLVVDPGKTAQISFYAHHEKIFMDTELLDKTTCIVQIHYREFDSIAKIYAIPVQCRELSEFMWHTATPPPPSFWNAHVRNGGGGAFFAMLPDLAVRRDTRIAVNCDRSWRQSRTQRLSAGAAAKGWAIDMGCDAMDLCNTQTLDRSQSARLSPPRFVKLDHPTSCLIQLGSVVAFRR
jgi:hypothetical protein